MPCIFGSGLTMQEAVACCLKQYPLLNPDRSKNASTAFGKVTAYIERKRKNIRSKSTQKKESTVLWFTMLYKPFKALKHMWNNNTNNKSLKSSHLNLSSRKTLILNSKKSSFLWTNVSACGCVRGGAATRWSRHRCRSGSCCVCSGSGRCFGPCSLPLFLLPLPRQICRGRSVCDWRVGWRGEIEKLWLGSACGKVTKEDHL